MISHTSYTNEYHVFRLADNFMNRCQEWVLTSRCLTRAGVSKCALWATSSPKLVFVKKSFIETPVWLYTVYGYFSTRMAELRSCDRDHRDHRV